MAEITSNGLHLPPTCTCGKGKAAVEMGAQTAADAQFSAIKGGPHAAAAVAVAAASSAEPREGTGDHSQAMEIKPSVPAEPSIDEDDAAAAAAAKEVKSKEAMRNSSSVPVVERGDSDGSSSSTRPVVASESETTLALARAVLSSSTSLALRVCGAVSDKLTMPRVAFVLFTTLALWRSAGHPRHAVWTFSVIATSYLSLWTICLTTRAILVRTVLVSVSYIALLAISISHLSLKLGIFIMLLHTAYAAALCGFALSEYRERKGLELAAEALHTRSKDGELKYDRAIFAMGLSYSCVISLLCTAGAALVVYYVVDAYLLVVVLSHLIGFSLWFWTVFVGGHLLDGAPLDAHHILFIYWGLVLQLLHLPDFFLSYLFGNAIGMLVHPLGAMGISVVLGYNVGVYVRYRQMLA